jgi:hypothetical protein
MSEATKNEAPAPGTVTYGQVRHLVELHGGTMEWQSGGVGGGGVWTLTLQGRTREVRVLYPEINDLDRLYVAKVPNPAARDDFGNTLTDDAFWRMVGLFSQ